MAAIHTLDGCQAGTYSNPCGCALSAEGVTQEHGAQPSPRERTLDKGKIVRTLGEIVDLAAEVQATRDAPNPGQRSARSAPVPGSRPPTDVRTMHALWPDGDADYVGRGLRGELAMCCRLVVEEMADTGTDIPDWPSDTWAGITGWLTQTVDSWIECPWADDIDRDIARIAGELRSLARVTRDPVYRCPQCDAPLRLQAGGRWLLCDSGHEESADLEAVYRRRPLAPASAVASEFGVTPEAIRQWRHRGKLPGSRSKGGELWVHPWSVLLLAQPVIGEAIATREAMMRQPEGGVC